MGVNQSPARRLLAAGPDAAANHAPGAEAAAELNTVTIRRLGAVYAPPAPASGATSPRTGADIEPPWASGRPRRSGGSAGPSGDAIRRCSDRCGTQRLAASRSRISVSSSTSETSAASSAAFCLAMRSLTLFIGMTMAK